MKDNRLKYILLVSILLNVSILATAAYTHFAGSQPFPVIHEPARTAHLYEELSLKPEQLKAFEQKASAFHAAIAEKKYAIDQKRGDLLLLMRPDEPDRKAIDDTIAQINRWQEDVQKTVAAHILELKGMLDKDQQKKFLDLIAKTMSKKRETGCP